MSSFQKRPKILAIVGPTASGKTSLSIEIARTFGGEIISADSRQVYRKMDLGTGKVTRREMRGIPHYLLDVASPRAIFTVQRYQKLGRGAVQKILRRKKIPIVVGGTGLYVDSLIYNYMFPSAKPDLALRKKLESKTTDELFARLQKLDPRRAATIDRRNPRRLVRALEIVLQTKQAVPDRTSALNRSSNYDFLILGIKISDKKLYANIHKRLTARLRHGMIHEVERLHENGLTWKRMENLGLEYRYLSRYLRGIITKAEMTAQLEHQIWLFSKRQMTWFKKNNDIVWVKNEKEAENKIGKFLK